MLICNASNVDCNDRGHIIKSTFRAILIHQHYYVRELFMCSRLISAVFLIAYCISAPYTTHEMLSIQQEVTREENVYLTF